MFVFPQPGGEFSRDDPELGRWIDRVLQQGVRHVGHGALQARLSRHQAQVRQVRAAGEQNNTISEIVMIKLAPGLQRCLMKCDCLGEKL